MKFPLSWLRDWVDLPEDLAKISDLLIRIGVGLEAVENPGVHMQNVVVARILKRSPHPNADKLSLCDVDNGKETLRIVCGAQNFKEGDLVPLAMEGALLPGDFKIKKSKIRGEESNGMLCSTEELGLGKGEDGLYLLPQSFKPGTPLAQALGMDDPVLTLETTANRPDHLSVRGIAREIAAVSGHPLKDPTKAPQEKDGEISGFQAHVQDPKLCPRYSARRIRGVKVAASPPWMQSRLQAAGIRPINNVVDATNYVLIEFGQPLHAFDLSQLQGGRIEARPAKAGEKLKTLDGQDRILDPGDIVIADGEKAVALGGVMGGAQSSVTEGSKDILIEAALFLPKAVRLSSRRLGLRSESSLRFERGVDPASLDLAMDRACALILELAGGSLSKGRLSAGPGLPPPPGIPFDPARANALLGSSMDASEMFALLKRRGFSSSASAPYKVTPPPHRRDLEGEADLAEEIAHMKGLDALPSTSLASSQEPWEDAQEFNATQRARQALQRLGCHEAYCGSFNSPSQLGIWSLAPGPALDFPLSEEESRLRPSLLPALVESALASLRRQAEGASLFEIGRVFPDSSPEKACLALVLAGATGKPHWAEKPRPFDYADLSGLAAGLAQELQLSLKLLGKGALPSWLHPGQAAAIQMGPMRGLMGALHPWLASRLSARQPVYVLEIEGLEKLQAPKAQKFRDFPRLPHVERDLSCLMDDSMEAGLVLDLVVKEGGFQSAQLRVKDVFRGAPLPEGKKSVTFSMLHLSKGQNLTDEEVNRAHNELCALIRQKLPVEIRD